MRKLITAGILATAATAATLAMAAPAASDKGQAAERSAEQFQRLDTNKDGVVDRAEFDARRTFAGLFAELDQGGKGKLNKAEFTQAMDRASADRRRRMAEALFDRLDANKDGTVTREEAAAEQRGGRRHAMMHRHGPDGAGPDGANPGAPPPR